jgi:K+-transporting ATPase KdpF subunit
MGSLPPGRCGVNALYIISGLLALGLCVYLLYAMFKPEKF